MSKQTLFEVDLPEPPNVRAISVHDFLAIHFPPRENVLNPWLPRQGLAMVHARCGVGKTHLSLGIGYADGVRRSVQGKAHVLVHGRRCPVVGRVTMDMIMVDLGPNGGNGVDVGDSVTVIGRDGEEQITFDDFAGWAGTISYEILTGLGGRLPRQYLPS